MITVKFNLLAFKNIIQIELYIKKLITLTIEYSCSLFIHTLSIRDYYLYTFRFIIVNLNMSFEIGQTVVFRRTQGRTF